MQTILKLLEQNWRLLLGAVVVALMITGTLLTKYSKHPRGQNIGKAILGFFSWVQHLDVGGLKIPLWPTKWPDPSQILGTVQDASRPAPSSSTTSTITKISLMIMFSLPLLLPACATSAYTYIPPDPIACALAMTQAAVDQLPCDKKKPDPLSCAAGALAGAAALVPCLPRPVLKTQPATTPATTSTKPAPPQ